jgi:intracellular sulfur oxidation DsrE/DsrF family protein
MSKLSIIIFFALLSLQSFAQEKVDHKIVFQFTNANDSMQQKAFMKQLENLTEYWPNAKYEVVLYNQGVELVMKSNAKFKEKLTQLKAKGIEFIVCENTLKNRKISRDTLMQEIVQYVPAGIAEIVVKQEQGWSYIKGGF